MLDCKELKEKLFHIYGRRIICRVGQGRPVYNATKEITQQPEADIAVYIQEKVRIAIVWDLAARKDYKKQIKNLSASESWDNIKPGKGELKVHYKRMGSSRDALFEKVLILDVDTLSCILEDLPLYLKVDPDDETCPQAVRQNEKEYDISPVEVRKRISTSRWERDWSFRNKVLAAYGFKCAICRCDEENLLEAAHIRSVADGGSDDVKNGICLCANHHIMFDKGLIKIDFARCHLTDVKRNLKNMPWYSDFVGQYGGMIESPNLEKCAL